MRPDEQQRFPAGRTRFARSGSLRIAFEVHPAPFRRRRPWLVMIQGLGFDRTGWDPVVPRLRRHFRLIGLDNRGCGASDRSERVFSVADLAADVVAVMDAAQVRKAHVIGVSLGGMIAQEVAIRHPERVDRLVLACTTPGWPSGFPMPQATMSLMSASPRMDADEALQRHVENALSPGAVAEHPDVVRELVERQRQHPGDQAGWMSLNVAGARYYGGYRQSSITAPTLVLHGSADTVVDPRNGELLAERIPDARLVVLPGQGHLFFWEDPRSLTDHVVPFLMAHNEPVERQSEQP